MNLTPRGLPPLPGPTLLDRLVTFVSPIRGLRRHQARAALALSGGYSGARYDRRALQEWYAGLGSADRDSLGDLTTLRARSRDLRRNAPLATGALNTIVTSAVGTGLTPRARIDRELLGLTEEEASAWEAHASRIWAWWAETPACDVTGRFDFATLQALVLVSSLESGDVLAIRRRKEGRARLLGLALQLLEADYLSNPQFGPDTDRLAGGVEINELGEPVRYHLASRHPGDFLGRGGLTWTAVPAVAPESGERLVLHIFDPLRPGQTRGVPLLAPVIEPLKQLDRYTEAELMAAVLAACFTVFIKHPTPDAPVGLGLPAGQLPPADPAQYRLGNGAILDLAAGESVETVNPGRPNDKFDPFVQAILQQVGVALEVPYELLVKRFNASYSASRAALLEAWRSFERRRATLVRTFCQPSYEWVIAESVAAGLLDAPGFFEDPLVRRAWCDAAWTGPAAGQIDERSAVESAILRVTNGLATLEEETAKLTGGDWEQNHAQQVKERRAQVRDGLAAPPAPVAPPTGAPTRNPRDPQNSDPGRTPPLEEPAPVGRLSLARAELVTEGGARA